MDRAGNTAIPRRIFLAALTGSVAASVAALQSESAPQNLFALRQGDIERLRLDFNSYRDKVRLVAILSPT